MTLLRTHGALVNYSRTGTGPPVLLIQGIGIVGAGWRPQVDGLADRYTMITFDNRGIGASTIGRDRLTVNDMAEDALAIMDAESIDRAHLVGHSMGGLIALQIALTAPHRVQSLALLCTFPDGRSGARISPAMLLTSLRTRVGTRTMRRNAFMELVMPGAMLRRVDREQLAEQLRPLFGRDLAEQPPIVMRQLRAMAQYDPALPLAELGSIRTLVASAAEDRIAPPRHGRRLAESIPGARYVELTDAGHGVPIQWPNLVNRLLDEHFAGDN